MISLGLLETNSIARGVIAGDAMLKAAEVTLIKAGAVITTPDMITPDRLISIRQQIQQILNFYRPDQIAFEELFFAKNITTGMNVSAARGVTVCTCAEYTKELYE